MKTNTPFAAGQKLIGRSWPLLPLVIVWTVTIWRSISPHGAASTGEQAQRAEAWLASGAPQMIQQAAREIEISRTRFDNSQLPQIKQPAK